MENIDHIDEAVVWMLLLPKGYTQMTPEQWAKELCVCMQDHGCDWLEWFPHKVVLSQALREAAAPEFFKKRPDDLPMFSSDLEEARYFLKRWFFNYMEIEPEHREFKQLAYERAKRIAEMGQAIGNLLAVIHGDGGHYFVQRGLEKSITDAEVIICDLRAELDRVKYKAKKMEEALKEWKIRLAFLGWPNEPKDWSKPVRLTEEAEKL